MSRLRVNNFGLSLDGYGAGPDQGVEHPLGKRGEELHAWFYPTATFQKMFGENCGDASVDDEFARRGMENIGAWIIGRNMFGPIRGEWPDEVWKGWWGDNPPYHTDVFVLTHHWRDQFEMEGGTRFHFVTGGIHAALEQAKAAANGKDVRVGGGANVIRQYLQAGLIDEMHLAVNPLVLGAGEPLLHGIDLPALGFKVTRYVPTARAAHYVLTKDV